MGGRWTAVVLVRDIESETYNRRQEWQIERQDTSEGSGLENGASRNPGEFAGATFGAPYSWSLEV